MNIRIYRDENGNELFEQWLSSIRDTRTSARIDNRLKRVRLGLLGDQRSIGEGMLEFRLDFGPGYRIYFGRIGREEILLLTGGDKNSQRRDIANAKRYWQHFRESMQ
ncbi:MAG: type II toxin-antitoxin system RelE/ParE family toxin [Candidatus Poribacteria bacterium]|nr:type II toxin-antitoxin system RelE/ParE family toxin [Candidatus Poribacteria bacterium]